MRHDGLPAPRRYFAVAAVWLALIVSVLDSSIANVALPSIARDLGARPADAIGVVSAFQLGVVVSLLPFSALGEIVSYRTVFITGIAVFVVASLACVASETLPELVLARALQGVGASGIMSVNGALARYTYPHHRLGAALGANALIIAAFGALGPTIASSILAFGPWQWLFAINLPIGVIAFAVAVRALPSSPKADRRLDVVSAGLNVAGFAFVVIGVDLLTRQPAIWAGVPALGAGAAAVGLLVWRSLSQPQPLVPFDLLEIRLIRLSALTSAATFIAQTLALVSMPFLLQDGLHMGLVEVGLVMTPWPAGVALAAPIAGRLADRVPVAVLGGWGLLVMGSGLLSLTWASPNADAVSIALRMGLCGFGFGFFQAPNNRAVLASAPMDRTGAAAGLVALSRTTGQIIGAMLVAIIFTLVGQSSHDALGLAAAMTAIAAAFSFARRAPAPSRA